MSPSTSSASGSSTTSTDTMEHKQTPKTATEAAATTTLPARKSFFRRATAKLRSSVCLPNSDTAAAAVSNPNTNGEEPKDEKKEESKDDANKDKPEDQTMKTEFKHLDRKIDNEDKPYFVERKNDVAEVEKKNWWELFAYCMVRRYDSDGDLEDTYLHVNPQPLRQLLKDVIGNYPSDPIDVDNVQICSPYHSLFHYRKQLQEVGVKRFEDEGDEQSLKELRLLLDWINTNFELQIAAYERCLSTDSKAVSYLNVWTLFPPDTIVHAKVQNHDRAFRVQDYWYDDEDIDDEPGFNIRGVFVDYDGEAFGHRKLTLQIPKYAGIREIGSQPLQPLQFLDDAAEVSEKLVARGKRFAELAAGQHFVQSEGIAIKRDPRNPCKYLRFDVNGRFMIDCKTYHRIDPNDTIWCSSFDKAHGPDLKEDDFLLASAFVRGYSMTAKRFVECPLDNISPIVWNEKCFEDLVLNPVTKKTVQALVSTHSRAKTGSSAEEGFDDIVQGKGKGLVCVLHGPPGVGKTLTAECVSEYVQRPLFMVSSGDLGTTSEQLDRQLTEIMDMTSTWRAVLLIDEADVFLEQRALHDLHRNSMVSVFLRVLEYYTGILFLTTNRVSTFDEAFKSRIHIPIRYTDLDVASRLRIWRSFCAKIPGGVRISDKELQTLAECDLNGRQIKNVIRAAESLAAFDNVKLDFKQLQQVTKIQATFEKDLTSYGDIDYTAPGSAKRHAESRNMYS